MGFRVQGLKFTSSVKHMEIFSNPSGPTQKVYIADVDKIRARQLPDGMSIYINLPNASLRKPVCSPCTRCSLCRLCVCCFFLLVQHVL